MRRRVVIDDTIEQTSLTALAPGRLSADAMFVRDASSEYLNAIVAMRDKSSRIAIRRR